MLARQVLIAALTLIACLSAVAESAPAGASTTGEATTSEGEAAQDERAAREAEGDDEVAPTQATSAVSVAPASQAALETLAFADHLFLDGDWYRAITEYRRFLFLVKGRHEQAPRAALAIGEALLRGEQWDAAGRQLDGVAQRTTVPEQRWTALFGAAKAYLADKRPELAKPRFRVLVEDPDTPVALREEARWLLAWGHFDAGELDTAHAIFSEIAQSEAPRAEAAAGVANALLERESLDEKNPVLAGALSLIPGFGHFYLGRYGVGFTSLAWNGLFIFATVSAWLTGQWGLALVLTFFEIGWYAGGVFGAVAGAFRHNRDLIRNWRDDVLARFGDGRELPEMHVFDHRTDAPPGALVRLGASF